MEVPSFCSHYFDSEKGPFLNVLEDLNHYRPFVPEEETFNSLRPPDYLETRKTVEEWLYRSFIEKGGKPVLRHPRYLTLGECSWLLDWFRNGKEVRIPVHAIPERCMSFTYPDSIVSFQLYRTDLSRPCYGKVFRFDELHDVISEFGWPGSNKEIKSHIYEKYIEVQVWDDEPLKKFIHSEF